MCGLEMKKKLTIKIGGDMDADDRELLTNIKKARRPSHTLYLDSIEQLHALLSPKKIHILKSLLENDDNPTVSELAKKTNRKQEAISRDIHDLCDRNLVRLEKKGQRVHAKTNYDKIVIEIPLAR